MAEPWKRVCAITLVGRGSLVSGFRAKLVELFNGQRGNVETWYDGEVRPPYCYPAVVWQLSVLAMQNR